MSSTFLRRGAVLVAVAVLALAGCSDDSPGAGETTGTGTPDATSTATPTPGTYDTAATSCTPVEPGESKLLAAATVTGDVGTTPEITVDPKLEVPDTGETIVSCTGDGPKIAEGELVSFLARVVTVADGSLLGATADPMFFPTPATTGELATGALAGLTVGTRILSAFPNSGSPAVQVFEIVDTFPTTPEVTDAKVGDAGLPTATAQAGTKPTVQVPDGGVVAPRGITRVVLDEGDGPVVETTDTIAAHYLGVQGSDGTEFDSSWSRGDEPTEFSLAQVVSGWTHGLAGVKAGSTVMLVIPPAYGYGLTQGHELATETMVFVVTIEKVVDAK